MDAQGIATLRLSIIGEAASVLLKKSPSLGLPFF